MEDEERIRRYLSPYLYQPDPLKKWVEQADASKNWAAEYSRSWIPTQTPEDEYFNACFPAHGLVVDYIAQEQAEFRERVAEALAPPEVSADEDESWSLVKFHPPALAIHSNIHDRLEAIEELLRQGRADEPRPAPAAPPPSQEPAPLSPPEIKARLESGQSIAQINRETKTPINRIQRVKKNYKIPSPPPGPKPKGE